MGWCSVSEEIMIGSSTLENVVSQHIERASLGECSLMGLFNKKKL